MRILFVRLSSFGDVVFALPAARALKTSLPLATLGWAIEEPLAPIVEGAPYVDEVFTAKTRAWRHGLHTSDTRNEIAAFLRKVRRFEPDVIVDAQGLFKSAWITALTPAKRKVGFGWRTATERINCFATREHVEAADRPHVLDRMLALAEHITGNSSKTPAPERTPDVRHLVEKGDPEVDAWLAARHGVRPFAVLQPFSSKKTKEWEPNELLAVSRGLSERGLLSVVRWGPGEKERAEELVSGSGGTLLLAPPTTPASTARLSARAALFIGVDTGPTHLSAAAGTPTLALFGPTPSERFGPVGPRAEVLRATRGDYNQPPLRAAKWPAHDVLAAAFPLLR